jgi:hypothetical protein
VPIEYKAGWAVEPVSVFWRRDKYLAPARIPWFLRHAAQSLVMLRHPVEVGSEEGEIMKLPYDSAE